MNKKIIAVIMCFIVICALTFTLVACQNGTTEINVYVPDGAPALAVAELFSLEKIEGAKLNIEITTGANVQTKVAAEEADIVICPTNMAANLYNKGAQYKLVTVNLFGLLYLVGNAPAANLSDLVGQVVHTIGKNNTPEFVFKKILDSANIEYVDSDVAVEGKIALRYYEKGESIVPLLKSGTISYAILGEPAATNSGAQELFDLQALWKQATNLDESYPQAGLFVSDKLLNDNKKLVKSFVKALQSNETYITSSDVNAAKILEEHGSNDFKGKTLTPTILQRCNVRCVSAITCKDQLIAYFNAIKSVNPDFALPNDGFYANID